MLRLFKRRLLSLLRSEIAIASREAAIDCVYVFFPVGVDKIRDVVDGVYLRAWCAVDRLAVPVEVLVGDFDRFRAVEVFYLVVYGSSDVRRKFA